MIAVNAATAVAADVVVAGGAVVAFVDAQCAFVYV